MAKKRFFDDETHAWYFPNDIHAPKYILAKLPAFEAGAKNIAAISRLFLAGSAAGVLLTFNFSSVLLNLKVFAKGLTETLSLEITLLCLTLLVTFCFSFILHVAATDCPSYIPRIKHALDVESTELLNAARKSFANNLSFVAFMFAASAFFFLAALVLAQLALMEVLYATQITGH